MNYIQTLIVTTVFSILYHIFIKKTARLDNNHLELNIVLFILLGIISLLILLFTDCKKTILNINKTKLSYIILLSFFFFVSNFFWIKCLTSNTTLSNTRLLKVSFELLILSTVGYFLLNDTITKTQFIGSLCILVGIHLITKK